MTMHLDHAELIEEPDYWGLIIAEKNQENYFLFQDAINYTVQDIKLGMNSYYLESMDQARSVYGGLKKIHFQDNKVEIQFSSTGAKKLGFASLSLFSTKPTLLKLVKDKLQKIIKKHEIENSN